MNPEEVDEREIDQGFLLGLKVHNSVVDKVLSVLRQNKVRYVATLRAFSPEDELRNLKSKNARGEEVSLGEGTIALLWKYIEDHRRHAPPSEMHSILRRDFNSLVRFMSAHLIRELEDGCIRKRVKRMPHPVNEDDPDKFIPLLTPLLGMDNARTKIFIRVLFPHTIERVVNWLEDPEHFGMVLILGGNPGCGKTVLGALVVLILASEGHVVMYAHHDTLMLILPPHDRVIPREQVLLDEVFQSMGMPPVRDPGAFDINTSSDNQMFRALLWKHLIFVQDVGDSTREIPPIGSGSIHLIVTSPNAGKLKHIQRLPLCETMVLPTWSEDEIMRLEARVSSDTVKTRFQRMGGIPRWVCDAREGIAEKRQDDQIRSLSFETLSTVMREQTFAELSPQGDKAGKESDLVIRIEPRPGDDSRVQPVITSDHVERQLARRYVEGTEFNVQGFIAATQNSSALAHFRGYAVEEFAHRSLTTTNKNLKMTKKRLLMPDETMDNTTIDLEEPVPFGKKYRYVDADLEKEIESSEPQERANSAFMGFRFS